MHLANSAVVQQWLILFFQTHTVELRSHNDMANAILKGNRQLLKDAEKKNELARFSAVDHQVLPAPPPQPDPPTNTATPAGSAGKKAQGGIGGEDKSRKHVQ